MDEAQIAKREQELREQYPAMFSHPECQAGEVWTGDQVVDVVDINAYLYKQSGLLSARVGNAKLLKSKFSYSSGGRKHEEERYLQHHGIFVNLREYILAEEASKQKKS